MRPQLISIVTLHVVILFNFAINGLKEFVAKIPNGANVPGVAGLGHVDPQGGGQLNFFGRAFQDAGYKWTTELCAKDSDGDGQTNGEELGDPCCTWSTGIDPQRALGVSHPGLASSTSNASLWGNLTCQIPTSAPSTGHTIAPSITLLVCSASLLLSIG